MPRKGHTEEQIIYALRQAEAGKKAGDICREMGVSQQAFYSWKRRYAGLGLNELRELRQLREENRNPQLHFRGLLKLHSRYGLHGCLPAQRRTFVPRLRPGQLPDQAAR